MYFAKLHDITANELKTGVTDLVITVPGWYTDIQRCALIDAANIASLNCLRLINDSTAVALGYGITKSDLPNPENPRNGATSPLSMLATRPCPSLSSPFQRAGLTHGFLKYIFVLYVLALGLSHRIQE